MNRRHLIAVGAAALVALAGSGCGDRPGPPEIGHASSGPITKQRVEEFARTVNLRAEDLPGAEVSPAEDSEGSPEVEAEFEKCMGDIGLPDAVGAVDSPSFSFAEAGELATFESSVSGAPTEEESAAFISALSTDDGFRCLERSLRRQIRESEGAENRSLGIEITKIQRPAPLDSPALGVRTHVPFESAGVEHDVYVDFIVFIAGHAEITFSALGMPTPVDQDVEAALVSKLFERAERHAL